MWNSEYVQNSIDFINETLATRDTLAGEDLFADSPLSKARLLAIDEECNQLQLKAGKRYILITELLNDADLHAFQAHLKWPGGQVIDENELEGLWLYGSGQMEKYMEILNACKYPTVGLTQEQEQFIANRKIRAEKDDL